MSSGGISYDCIRGSSRKVTLPSVEMWGTDMNILKDPPKSLFTRRIDKVGQTSEILNMIDDSGDRICEMIKLYPRGVNPSVSVSYSNYGTNGGQNRMAAGTDGNCCSKGISTVGQQAKLPYRVDIQGAYRAPIRTGFDLLPLSRMPRVWTYAFSNPAMPRYMELTKCDEKDYGKAIKEHIIKSNVTPNAVYNIGNSVENYPGYQVKNMIVENPINVEANSGYRTQDVTSREVKVPTKGVNENYTTTSATAQLGSENRRMNGQNNVDVSKYIIEDPNYSNITTNISNRMHVTPLENLDNNNRIVTKDPLHTNHTTSIKGYQRNLDVSHDMELTKNVPNHSLVTNKVTNTQRILEADSTAELERKMPIGVGVTNCSGIGNTNVFMDREFNYLPKKSKIGSFDNYGSKPRVDRDDMIKDYEAQKNALNKKAYNAFAERFGT